MAAMTFKEIVDAVLADAFDESKRADAQTWVVARHAWVWGANNWTFKQAIGSIVFTAGQQISQPPTDVNAIFAIYDGQGEPLTAISDLRSFYDQYNTLGATLTGAPEAYTVVDGNIIIGPEGDGTTGLIVYQKTKPALVNDSDPTGLPDGFDLMLVHGGKAEGFKLTNVPLATQFDADFNAAVDALANDNLEAILETGGQAGAFRPGTSWPAYGR